MRRPHALALLVVAVFAGACSRDEAATNETPAIDIAAIGRGESQDFGSPPPYPDGPWSEDIAANLGSVVASLTNSVIPEAELKALGRSEDVRVAWALSDLQRLVTRGPPGAAIESATSELLGIEFEPGRSGLDTIDYLIAWDVPTPPGYFIFKRDLYSRIDPRWGDLFSDINTVDWRLVSWGGVFIDDRPAGSSAPCDCIPALDDPTVTAAADGDWYPDDRIVFGVVVGDEARAYPKNSMETHEMVNDTLGGRRIGMPYCTLCGAAQAYLTDELGDEWDQPVFRTSGLLIRSNKMMYELTTKSLIDTFVGEATSGPMGEAGISFEQVSVVTTTWGAWKAAHPETTIVAEDGGIGRTYDLNPLRGRDDNGPIFPIGSADDRLPVQEAILGVLTDDETPVAFHVASAIELLTAGERVVVDDFELLLDGDGLRAVLSDGTDAGSHQAFWFAWSQFRPRTKLWPHDFQAES